MDPEKPSFYQLAKEIADTEADAGDELDALMNTLDADEEEGATHEIKDKGTVEKWKAGQCHSIFRNLDT